MCCSGIVEGVWLKENIQGCIFLQYENADLYTKSLQTWGNDFLFYRAFWSKMVEVDRPSKGTRWLFHTLLSGSVFPKAYCHLSPHFTGARLVYRLVSVNAQWNLTNEESRQLLLLGVEEGVSTPLPLQFFRVCALTRGVTSSQGSSLYIFPRASTSPLFYFSREKVHYLAIMHPSPQFRPFKYMPEWEEWWQWCIIARYYTIGGRGALLQHLCSIRIQN